MHTFILLGQAYLGLRDYPRAREHLSEAVRLSDHSMGIADWHMFLPLYQGQAEYWLAQGDLTQAREMAATLCAHAAPAPERTYLALGHQLLAEIALAENQCEQAAAEIDQALAVLNDAEIPVDLWKAYAIPVPECASANTESPIPLAAWRVYLTAAKLSERQGQSAKAETFRQQSCAVIQRLADSLESADPLRASLVAGHERLICSAVMT